MSSSLLIALAVIVPILIALVIVFFVYIIGNVYNGFVRRRHKVETSWHELTKLIVKCYRYLPDLIRLEKLPSEQRQKLIDIYKEYRELDIDKDIEKLASLDNRYKEAVHSLSYAQDMSKENPYEVVEFIISTRRTLDFSIPLYNSNVSDYEHFRRLPINRLFAKMFKFEKETYFMIEQPE